MKLVGRGSADFSTGFGLRRLLSGTFSEEKYANFGRNDAKNPKIVDYKDSLAVDGVSSKPLSGIEFPANREFNR